MDDTAQDLDRFVTAQEPVYPQVLDELAQGQKRTHWMWFIFPQHTALGRSAMAKRYGIGSAQEARAYLAHPLLGPRLLECSKVLLTLPNPDAQHIFGATDARKLQSCMTLFARIAPRQAVFQQVLDRLYAGQPDAATLQLLQQP